MDKSAFHIQSVVEFISECYGTLRLCHNLLGLDDNSFTLDSLIKSARSSCIPRRGFVTGKNIDIRYHVHGSGYTFVDATKEKELRFDVRPEDGQLRITINAWKIEKYFQTMLHLDQIEERLRELSQSAEMLVHVCDPPVTYFYLRE